MPRHSLLVGDLTNAEQDFISLLRMQGRGHDFNLQIHVTAERWIIQLTSRGELYEANGADFHAAWMSFGDKLIKRQLKAVDPD